MSNYEYYNKIRYEIDQKLVPGDQLQASWSKEFTQREGSFYPISKQYLSDLFFEIFDTREDLIETIKNSKIISRKAYPNQADFENAVESLSYDFTSQQSFTNEVGKFQNSSIRYYGDILDAEINEILLITLTTVNNKVRIYITEQFNKKIQDYKNVNERLISRFNLEIKDSIYDFDLTTKNRIAVLKEQSEIARALKIQDNLINTEFFATYNSFVSAVEDRPLYRDTELLYLRGYRAIEAEINLLKQRINKEPFMQKLLTLQNYIREINQDDFYDLTLKTFNSTPLNDENLFKAVDFDINTMKIKFEKPLSKSFIAIFGFVGFVGALFILFASNVIRTAK